MGGEKWKNVDVYGGLDGVELLQGVFKLMLELLHTKFLGGEAKDECVKTRMR